MVTGVDQTANKVTVGVDYADAATAGTASGGASDVSGGLLNGLMDKANEQAQAGPSTALTSFVGGLQSISGREQAQLVLDSNSGAVYAETPSVLLRNDALANAQVAQRTHQLLLNGVSGVWANVSTWTLKTLQAVGIVWTQKFSLTRLVRIP